MSQKFQKLKTHYLAVFWCNINAVQTSLTGSAGHSSLQTGCMDRISIRLKACCSLHRSSSQMQFRCMRARNTTENHSERISSGRYEV
eukprot:666460-Hanusia_phi.AAC.2